MPVTYYGPSGVYISYRDPPDDDGPFVGFVIGTVFGLATATIIAVCFCCL